MFPSKFDRFILFSNPIVCFFPPLNHKCTFFNLDSPSVVLLYLPVAASAL